MARFEEKKERGKGREAGSRENIPLNPPFKGGLRGMFSQALSKNFNGKTITDWKNLPVPKIARHGEWLLPEGLSVERLKRANALSADLRDLGFSVHWNVLMTRLFERVNTRHRI